MAKPPKQDPAMSLVRAKVKDAGLTLHALGLAMGFPETQARMAAFQALKVDDPRISTLRRFARALGIPMDELVAERKHERAK